MNSTATGGCAHFPLKQGVLSAISNHESCQNWHLAAPIRALQRVELQADESMAGEFAARVLVVAFFEWKLDIACE
jgi:hypothetical protein